MELAAKLLKSSIAMGIQTIGDLAKVDRNRIVKTFGKRWE